MGEHLRWLEELRARVFEVSGVPADVLSGPASLSSAAAIRERLDCLDYNPTESARLRALLTRIGDPEDGPR